MYTAFRNALLLAAATYALAACKKDDDATPVTAAGQANTVSVLSAAGTTSSTGQPVAAKHYTFFSLADNKQVAYTDSNSTKWDVAFRGTTILLNGGTSGPGQGGAQVLSDKLFAEVIAAPTSGYAVDAASGYAIPAGSGKGWYSYDATTHLITPTAGKVLALRTATGKYAKMEIQSYYKNAKGEPIMGTPTGTDVNNYGYYTFRYVYQPSGTSLQ